MKRLSPAFALALAIALSAPAADRLVPGKLPTGEMLLPNGRLLTPAGTQTGVAPYPFALALTPDGGRVVVACTGADDQSLHLLDAATGKSLAKEPVKKSWLGLAVSPDGKRVYLSGAGGKNVLVYRLENDRFVAEEPIPLLRKGGRAANADATPSGLAVPADGKSLWVARILLERRREDRPRRRGSSRPRSPSASTRTARSSRRTERSSRSRTGAAPRCRSSTPRRGDRRREPSRRPTTRRTSPSRRTGRRSSSRSRTGISSRPWTSPRGPSCGRSRSRSGRTARGRRRRTPSRTAPRRTRSRSLRTGRRFSSRTRTTTRWPSSIVEGDVRAARTKGFVPSGWYPAALALSRDGKTLWVANAKGGWSWSNAVGGPDPTKKGGRQALEEDAHDPGLRLARRRPVPDGAAAHTARAYANRRPGARGAAPVEGLGGRPGGARRHRRRSSTSSTSSARTARTTRCSATCPQGNGDPVARDLRPRRHAERPRARRGVRPPRQPLLRRRGLRGRPQLVDGGLRDGLRREALAARLRQQGLRLPVRGERRERVSDERLPLGRRRARGAHAPELRGVRRRRRRDGRRRPSPVEGHGGRPRRQHVSVLPRLRPRHPRQRARRHLPQGVPRLREGEGDAAPHDRAARQRPHGGDEEGRAHAARDGRRERRRARAPRRGDLALAVLEGHGDLRDRGRRAERLGPRGRAPDGRAS